MFKVTMNDFNVISSLNSYNDYGQGDYGQGDYGQGDYGQGDSSETRL